MWILCICGPVTVDVFLKKKKKKKIAFDLREGNKINVLYDTQQKYPGLVSWQVTHIWVGKIIIIGSDNGLSPGRRQAIIWTNAGILLIGTLETNVNEISIEIHAFSFKKFHLKMLSGKWRPSCLGLNVLNSLKQFGRLSKSGKIGTNYFNISH